MPRFNINAAREVEFDEEIDVVHPDVPTDLDRRSKELGGETQIVCPGVPADLDRLKESSVERRELVFRSFQAIFIAARTWVRRGILIILELRSHYGAF